MAALTNAVFLDRTTGVLRQKRAMDFGNNDQS